jgi:sec-independent protein translocase protein TatB
MFGAGWTEMLIIGVVALVVIGPKDLPVVMAKLGRMVRTVRRMGDEFRRELDKTTGLDQITELRRSITEPLRQTSDEIMREFNRQTATGVEPSGIMKPTDPNVESVYDQIAATSGLPPKSATPEGEAEPLPAPAEAKPRRARKPKAAKAAAAETAPAAAAKPKRGSPAKTGPGTSRPSRKTAAPAEPAPVEATPAIAAAEPAKVAAPSSRKRGTARKPAPANGKAANGKVVNGKANGAAAANGSAVNGSAIKSRRAARPKAVAKPAEPPAPPLPAEEA